MKKLTLTVMVSLASSLVLAFGTFAAIKEATPIDMEPPRPLALIVPSIEKVEVKLASKSYSSFLHEVGKRESSNRYEIVNKFGYMGKYQFGRKTLDGLGFEDITNKEFLNSPRLQEQAMSALLRHNKRVLKRLIKKYEGKTVHGIYVTESGLLAAAHLAGPGNVRKWLRSGKEFKDGLGTSIVSYIVKFSGYQV